MDFTGDDDLDFSDMKPMDAFEMKMEDLVVEFERRGMHPKGFFNDDARELQKVLDKEFSENLEKLKAEKRAALQRNRMKAKLQKKRLQLEKQLREEQDAIHDSLDAKAWLNTIKNNQTRDACRIECDSIVCRALAKALWSSSYNMLGFIKKRPVGLCGRATRPDAEAQHEYRDIGRLGEPLRPAVLPERRRRADGQYHAASAEHGDEPPHK